MAAPNFVLLSPLQLLERNDFSLSNPAPLNPLDSFPLVDGEFLEMDAANPGKLKRGVTVSGLGTELHEGKNPIVYPIFSERGRSDVQAIQKVTALVLGMYRAETTLCDAVTGTPAVGDPLSVQDVQVGGGAYVSGNRARGLAKLVTLAGAVIVGYVESVVGSKIRFVHYGNQKTF